MIKKECEFNFIDGDSADYESGTSDWIAWECSNCGFTFGEDASDCEEIQNSVNVQEKTGISSYLLTSYQYCPKCGAKIKRTRELEYTRKNKSKSALSNLNPFDDKDENINNS